jgi:GDP-L-fucose synthase
MTAPRADQRPGAIAKSPVSVRQVYRRQYDFTPFRHADHLYGPNDNFDLASSHVLPALLRKFHEAKLSGAKTVTIWGSGTPRREFLHVYDLADACLFLMERYDSGEIINIAGKDIMIAELAALIAR